MAAARLPIHDRMLELADATRCRLLAALERQELTVGELVTALRLPQSTVSRHLKVLADEGWIVARAEGASHWYRRHPALGDERDGLWRLVRSAWEPTPAARQDAARIEAVLASRRSATQAFFATASAEWDALRASLFGARADLAALPALFESHWVVGDLGCGTGMLSAALAPHVSHVQAVDASPAMLETATMRLGRLANVTVTEGALEALPLADASLDVAILMLVLHHVADPARALAEERYREQMGHVWLGIPADTLTGWLTDAGFEGARYVALPVDPAATGPALFSCTARAMPRAPSLHLA